VKGERSGASKEARIVWQLRLVKVVVVDADVRCLFVVGDGEVGIAASTSMWWY